MLRYEQNRINDLNSDQSLYSSAHLLLKESAIYCLDFQQFL